VILYFIGLFYTGYDPKANVWSYFVWSVASLILLEYQNFQNNLIVIFKELGYGTIETVDVSGVNALCMLLRKDLEWNHIHVSGHGSGDQIKQIIEGSNTKTLIPIHTEHEEFHKSIMS